MGMDNDFIYYYHNSVYNSSPPTRRRCVSSTGGPIIGGHCLCRNLTYQDFSFFEHYKLYFLGIKVVRKYNLWYKKSVEVLIRRKLRRGGIH